jgi:hypothetical protein
MLHFARLVQAGWLRPVVAAPRQQLIDSTLCAL